MKRLMNKIVPMVLVFSALMIVQLQAGISEDIAGLQSIQQEAQQINSTRNKRNVNPNTYMHNTKTTLDKMTQITSQQKESVKDLVKQFCNTAGGDDYSKRYTNDGLTVLNNEINLLIGILESKATVQPAPRTTTVTHHVKETVKPHMTTHVNHNPLTTNQKSSAEIVADVTNQLAQKEDLTQTITQADATNLDVLEQAAIMGETRTERIKRLAHTAVSKTKETGAYAVNKAKQAGGAVVSGAQYAGESVVSGAKRAGGATIRGTKYAGQQAMRPVYGAMEMVTPLSAEEKAAQKANAEKMLTHANFPKQKDELLAIIKANEDQFKDTTKELTLMELTELDRNINNATAELKEVVAQEMLLKKQAGQLDSYWTAITNKVNSKAGMMVIGGVITAGLITAAIVNREAIKSISKQDITNFFSSGAEYLKNKANGLYQMLPSMPNVGQYMPTMESMSARMPNVRQYMPSMPNVGQYMPTMESMGAYVPSRETVASYIPTRESATQYAKDTAASYIPTTKMGALKSAGLIGAGYALGGREGALLAATGPGTAVWTAIEYYTKWKNAVAIGNIAKAAINEKLYNDTFAQLTDDEKKAVLANLDVEIDTLKKRRKDLQTRLTNPAQ